MRNLTAINYSSSIIRLFSCSMLFFLLPSFTGHDFTLIKELTNVQGTKVFSDKFGCAYVATSKNALTKLCADSSRPKNYAMMRFGKITYADVSNPLKILVFYKDFATIVILDNTLSEQGLIDLRKTNILQPGAICLSLDNNIWVYDELEYRLKKLNTDNQVYRQSEDFTILFPEGARPNFMLETENQLFVNDPEHGIRVFDVFGAYSKTIPIKGLERFQIVRNQLFYFQNGQLFSYHLKTFDTKPVALPSTSQTHLLDVNIQEGTMVCLYENALLLYAFK
ncbi:MAG: hypothetical protein SFW35_10885 [Chitinophagales bacterium]|nr:hypothetical protein [Chitinophagales bacterium]